MCTLTFLSFGESCRLAFNRDELRSRSPGMPPEKHTYGKRLALHPTDSQSGGTWIACNDAGLALAIMNRNDAPVVDREGNPIASPFSLPDPLHSRGSIIPALLHLERLREIPDTLRHLDLIGFLPFHLFAFQDGSCLRATWDTRKKEIFAIESVLKPFIFTSSGLGDSFATGHRQPIFDAFFSNQASERMPQQQDAFHAHQSPGALWCSVNMIRPDARTVSYTTILIAQDTLAMRYVQAGALDSEDPFSGQPSAGEILSRA